MAEADCVIPLKDTLRDFTHSRPPKIKSTVGTADKEHALKKNQKQSTYQRIALDLFFMRMPLRGVLLLLPLSRSDVKTTTNQGQEYVRQ